MRGLAWTVVIGVAVLGVLGCGNKAPEGPVAVAGGGYEAVLAKMTAALDDCNALLSSMKLPGDSAEAGQKLDDAARRFSEAGAELLALPAPSADQKKLVGSSLDARVARFAAEVQRLRTGPDLAETVKGGTMKETAAEPSLIDKAKQKVQGTINKIKKKVEVRTFGGTSSVRG